MLLDHYYQHDIDCWQMYIAITATGDIDNCINKFMDPSLYDDAYVSMTAYTDMTIGQLTERYCTTGETATSNVTCRQRNQRKQAKSALQQQLTTT